MEQQRSDNILQWYISVRIPYPDWRFHLHNLPEIQTICSGISPKVLPAVIKFSAFFIEKSEDVQKLYCGMAGGGEGKVGTEIWRVEEV